MAQVAVSRKLVSEIIVSIMALRGDEHVLGSQRQRTSRRPTVGRRWHGPSHDLGEGR